MAFYNKFMVEINTLVSLVNSSDSWLIIKLDG